MPARMLASVFSPNPRKAAELPGPRERFEARDGGDSFLLVEDPGGLGADAGNAHQFDDAGGNAFLCRLHILHPAGPKVLGDLPGEVRPDAGDLVQPPFPGDDLDILREALQVQRSAAVGADPEGVLPSDLQEIGHQIELTGYFEVLHGAPSPLAGDYDAGLARGHAMGQPPRRSRARRRSSLLQICPPTWLS